MRRSASGVLGVAFLLGIFACSSSDTSTKSTSTSSSSSSSGSSCSCTAIINGSSVEVACGSSQCVAGATYECSKDGSQLTQGARCADSNPDAGGATTGEGCGLFTCRATADCGGIAPCFSTTDGNSYCYEQEGSPSQCSPGSTATTKTTSNGPTTICVPTTCPTPGTFLP